MIAWNQRSTAEPIPRTASAGHSYAGAIRRLQSRTSQQSLLWRYLLESILNVDAAGALDEFGQEIPNDRHRQNSEHHLIGQEACQTEGAIEHEHKHHDGANNSTDQA